MKNKYCEPHLQISQVNHVLLFWLDLHLLEQQAIPNRQEPGMNVNKQSKQLWVPGDQFKCCLEAGGEIVDRESARVMLHTTSAIYLLSSKSSGYSSIPLTVLSCEQQRDWFHQAPPMMVGWQGDFLVSNLIICTFDHKAHFVYCVISTWYCWLLKVNFTHNLSSTCKS